jgi:elongation factor Ts
MADITVEDIKKLREMTGVGITDAKKALEAAGGDFDKALEAMRKKGFDKATKRADKEVNSGLIGSYVHDGRIGVLVEVNCETDFVAKTDEFKGLVKDLCLHIAASEAKTGPEILKEPFVKNLDITVDEYIKEHIAKLGENIILSRFSRFRAGQSD